MNSLEKLSKEVGEALKSHGFKLATAESCTGGMIAALITSIPGSSAWFDRGFVTYTNESKVQMLGVSQDTIDRYGVVSEEVAQEMAAGAIKNSQADVSISVTGIAGPGGGTDEKPVGTVCFGWEFSKRKDQNHQKCHFEGDREAVRYQAVEHSLKVLLRLLEQESV